VVPVDGVSAQREALAELSRRGIEGSDILLLDVLPLIEMAWSDGVVQEAERHVIEAFLEDHVERINEESPTPLLTHVRAQRFVQRFIDHRPTAQEFRELRALLRVLRLSSSDRSLRARRILEGAMSVGGISPSPTRPATTWDSAEVECMWELEEALAPRPE
jgi:hypothetical protein